MEVKELLVYVDHNIKQVLETLERTALGIVFVVNEEAVIVGILTDGDVRRSLLKGAKLTDRVDSIMNKSFISLPINTENSEILKKINSRVKVIPLLDSNKKIIDYASINKIRQITVASPVLTGNELAYITDCIQTNWISSQGKYVTLFEEMFSKYHDNFYALAVSNGTVALHLALVSLGIKAGDEVIVPNLTFAASVNAILYTGATPVLADVDPVTWNISVDEIKKLITPKTRAIMLVHLYGYPCEMEQIKVLANEYKLYIVEDCAEALGSTYNGKPVGVFGDVSTFSFYGNKTITTGEGGMVIMRDEVIYDKAKLLRDHGMDKKHRYWHLEVGYNYRLTNIQAAIGVAQFERLTEFVNAKREIARKYSEALSGIPFFQIPHESDYSSNSYWLYTFLVLPNAYFTRDDLILFLSQKGIETRPVFYTIDEMPPYKDFGNHEELLVSKMISKCGVSLPSSVNLSLIEVEHICEVINQFVRLI